MWKDWGSLITTRAVTPYFQPIIRMLDNSTIGFELLGRVGCDGIPSNIPQLFQLAKQLKRDVELSLLFRDSGIMEILTSQIPRLILFNTVPNKMDINGLEQSLLPLNASY